jgi:hypothetical protein
MPYNVSNKKGSSDGALLVCDYYNNLLGLIPDSNVGILIPIL